MATLNDLISTFTETDLQLIVPLDLQDVSESDFSVVNEYNSYLNNGEFSSAITYRENHPELEKYILDVKKINILQTMWMNAYIYAKNRIQQCRFAVEQPEEQTEGDIWFKIDSTQSTSDCTVCRCYQKTSTGEYVEFSIISPSIFEEITDAEIDSIFLPT